jgi:ABC-2 type transport system permease protein
MEKSLNLKTIWTIAARTFGQAVKSPTAYIVGIFYYGFVGGLFGTSFLLRNNGAIDGVGEASLWILWFVVPGLTMGLISEELRSGTFEQLATLPLKDW